MRILKQRGLPSWDLTASVLVAAIALALSIFQPELIDSSAGVLLFALLLLLPGYLFSIALFPRRFDIAGKGRLALSIVAGIIFALILSLALSLSPWSLSSTSLAEALAIVSLIMAVVAHFSRTALPMWSRFVPFISGSGRRYVERRREEGIYQRIVDKIPMLAAAVVLVAIAYSAINLGNMGGTNPTGDAEASFTEFYIQGENKEDHPLFIVAGNRTTTVVGIINHELGPINYTLRLVQNGSILSQKEITLDHNQSWEGALDYVLEDFGSLVRLDFLLYKEGDFSVPYSEDHLWFNVSDANATSEKPSETLDNETINPEQSKKVVVLGANSDESGDSDNKKSSYIYKASSPASTQTSSQLSSQASSQPAVKPAPKIAESPQSGDETLQTSIQEMESELSTGSEQKDESIKASSENASSDMAASSSTQKSETTESKETLIAAAMDTEKDIPTTIAKEDDISAATVKEDGISTATAVTKADDTPKIDNPEKSDVSDKSSSVVDGPKASDSAADTKASSVDQDASSPSGENKNGVEVSKADQSVSQKDGAGKTSGIDNEIDSWVNTRGISKSDQSHSFSSKDIQYVKSGGSKETAVLGSQFKGPVRVGK